MNSKLNDEVGKKIVEALKKQTKKDSKKMDCNDLSENAPNTENPEIINKDVKNSLQNIESIDVISSNESVMTELSLNDCNEKENLGFEFDLDCNITEIPSNIIILKKLVSQLPNGVSRQMGAQIIKQTMEALGVSMTSLLEEAQEVQTNFKTSTKECQNLIQDYKNKIKSLEKQVSDYKKQYGALNDLINLFIKTTK